MITFIVQKNGVELCQAGVPGEGFLYAFVTAWPKDESDMPLRLKVGGTEMMAGKIQKSVREICKELGWKIVTKKA